MAPGHESTGPTYLSARSADVILSEIRPIKLKVEALRCINVLLDELLWSVLTASRSLAPEHLRAGLRAILPTSLGQEALLEAELELRAYLDRTQPSSATPSKEDDGQPFELQYAFELLRLKCEAYSTLNDSDEDAEAERRLQASMAGSSPPKPATVAQAALYMTAIVEAICEHVLGILGRVTARDSSRTVATVQDLFVALCEDETIFSLFKTMKVYKQIETLSKSQPRRSGSGSRGHGERSSRSDSHASGPRGSGTSRNGHVSRMSSDSSKSAKTLVQNPPMPRPSVDKKGGLKMLLGNRSTGSENGHGLTASSGTESVHSRSESVVSDETKQTWQSYASFNSDAMSPTTPATAEEPNFDDLMRSGSTMKMSLTPDRLKTMEVYRQERGMRGPTSKRIPPPKIPSKDFLEGDQDSTLSQRTYSSGRPTLNRVDSILEDEEDAPQSAGLHTPSQNGTAPHTAPAMPRPTQLQNPAQRLRNASSNGSLGRREVAVMPPIPSANAFSTPKRERPTPPQLNTGGGGPPRRSHVARNMEDMDLDDIMNGSDEDEPAPAASTTGSSAARQQTQVVSNGPKSAHPGGPNSGVSKSTRELMDFLSEGPPDADIPPLPRTASAISTSFDTRSPAKGSRLQRMVSKLTRQQSTERMRGSGTDDLRMPALTNRSMANPPSAMRSTSSPMPGDGPMPPMPRAVLPRPPRPPPVVPISPPSSPSQLSMSTEDAGGRQSQQQSKVVSPRKAVPSWEAQQDGTVSAQGSVRMRANTMPAQAQAPVPMGAVSVPLSATREEEKELPSLAPPTPSPSRDDAGRPSPSPSRSNRRDARILSPPSQSSQSQAQARERPAEHQPASQSHSPNPLVDRSQEDIADLRRLMGRATTADECRLIMEMFLSRAGRSPAQTQQDQQDAMAPGLSEGEDVPYPSPSPSLVNSPKHQREELKAGLEKALVTVLLGDEAEVMLPPPTMTTTQAQTPKVINGSAKASDRPAPSPSRGRRKDIEGLPGLADSVEDGTTATKQRPPRSAKRLEMDA